MLDHGLCARTVLVMHRQLPLDLVSDVLHGGHGCGFGSGDGDTGLSGLSVGEGMEVEVEEGGNLGGVSAGGLSLCSVARLGSGRRGAWCVVRDA